MRGTGKARAIMYGGTQETDSMLFEGARDVLVFQPEVKVDRKQAWTLRCEVKLRPCIGRSEERWLVVCYAAKCQSSHVCVLGQRGRQLLGAWCGVQNKFFPCEPECDLSGRDWLVLFAVAQWRCERDVSLGKTTFWVDGVKVGEAGVAIRAPISGLGNIATSDALARKQVVGYVRRFDVYDGVVDKDQPVDEAPPAQHPRPPEEKPRVVALLRGPRSTKRKSLEDSRTPKRQQVSRVETVQSRAVEPRAVRTRTVRPPKVDPDLTSVLRSRALSAHGEEADFEAAARSAIRGASLWLQYSDDETWTNLNPELTERRVRRLVVHEARHECAFKFRGHVYPLGDPGPSLEELAKAQGASAAMAELLRETQMSTLFAPTGAGDISSSRSSLDFAGYVKKAEECDACRPQGSKDDREESAARAAAAAAGSTAPKVTEWKPDWMIQGGQKRLAPPAAWDSANWLTHLSEHRFRQIFRPKLAMMLAGALTAHHRDNFGTWTWIKVIGGEQLVACWPMAAGDATPGLGDDADHELPFRWDLLVEQPAARLVVLRAGDFFLMRPGTYHRVVTLQTKLQLFGEFIWGESFATSLASAIADKTRPNCLSACDTSLKMADVCHTGLICDLKAALARADEPRHRTHLQHAIMLLTANGNQRPRAKLESLRWAHPDCLATIVRYLRFDLDACCHQILHHDP